MGFKQQMAVGWNSEEQENFSSEEEIKYLKDEVSKRFPLYNIRTSSEAIAFFIKIDEETLEENFDMLRNSLYQKQYIPMLRHEKGEDVLYIIRKPQRKEKPIWIPITLLIATIVTTILTGSLLEIGYSDLWSLSTPMEILQPKNLINGALYFSVPLISILFIHEMGHYLTSKKYGISASFPYFIPIPPILPGFNIGTFGAVISSGDPMTNKKTLFDVGISGPLSGFFIAVPVTIIGIATSDVVKISEVASGEVILGSSFLFSLLGEIIHPAPEGFALNLNAIAFAGWVGLLITSINLLPAGQLDGGHIFRAVLGDKQKYAGWVAVIIMIFTGWMFFAILIIFAIGLMHPPPLNDYTKLDGKRKLLFVIAVAILILCFIPFPIYFLP
jgi:membrane-associated protease RseP (regulator of RpoE activity)